MTRTGSSPHAGQTHERIATIAALERLESGPLDGWRSEEHTSELQSPAMISYAVFCLKKSVFRSL